MFGQKTRPIADFLPRILSHIDGVDADMVSTYTMDSIIQFLRDTKILKEVVCLELDPCTPSYKLHTNNRITEVMSVRFFSDDTYQLPPNTVDYRVQDDTLYVGTIPPCHKLSAEIELAVAPSRDSEEVPEFIYEDWVDAITALTLSKLYLLTDNEWYNPQAANNQTTLYSQLVRQARFTNITKHKPFQMRLANKRRF